jgi:hypothetical protein
MINIIKDRVDPDELVEVLKIDIDTLVDLCYPLVIEAIDEGRFEYLERGQHEEGQ